MMMHKKLFIPRSFIFILLIHFFSLNSTMAQTLSEGPQVLSFHSDVDDTEQPYGIYIPPNYQPTKKYPLVVMLHGAGSNHRLSLRRVFGKSNQENENDVEASRYFPEWKDRDYIVASAYARGTMGYQGIAEKDVLDMIDDVKQRFNIDENRTYLTGLSMGGGGAMWIGLSYPDLWAAVAPVCPAYTHGTLDFSDNAINYPMSIHQGDQDQAVSPERVRSAVEHLKAKGINTTYTEYPGVGHNSWEDAYADGKIFDWFDQYKRNPFPKRIKFATDRYASTKAYWMKIDKINPDQLCTIDIQFTDKNQIEATTKNIGGFTLTLDGHPMYDKTQPIRISVNKQSFTIKDKNTFSLYQLSEKWQTGHAFFIGNEKRPGLEGPMIHATYSRHIYVFGTADKPSKVVYRERKAMAERAANWSEYRDPFLERVMVFPRVMSDKQVRESDLKDAHLILFGDKTTNLIIQKYADQLPLHLKETEGDYGLAYIFPINNKYVLINSGLSVFDAPKPGNTLSRQYQYALPSMMKALDLFGDFILFTKDELLINDHFNSKWKLDFQSKKKLKGLEIVEIKE